MLRRMPPSTDVDDLIQAGTVGLLEAASRYRASAGSSFATYAKKRIRGAILDSSRRADWCSRSVRRRMRAIDSARRRAELRAGAAVGARAVAAAAGITLEEYFRALRDVDHALQVRLDDAAPVGGGATPGQVVDDSRGPAEEFERGESLRTLNAALQALPKFERDIFRLYHDEKFLMREIGVTLSLSESRVSQIHKQTMQRLRSVLR